MPKQKPPQVPSTATKKPPEPSSQGGKAQVPLLPELSIEEQKALGIDTGPVLIVSTAPKPKPASGTA